VVEAMRRSARRLWAREGWHVGLLQYSGARSGWWLRCSNAEADGGWRGATSDAREGGV
jgi:hypothetical protein